MLFNNCSWYCFHLCLYQVVVYQAIIVFCLFNNSEIGAVCAAFAAASAKVFLLMPTWPGNQQKIISDVVKESCNSRMSNIRGFFNWQF